MLDNQRIRDHLELGLVGQKISKKEREERERKALERVHLDPSRFVDLIFVLLGGEAQRVALAMLFLKHPPLIVADEPTASLDPKTAQNILSILFSMRSPQQLDGIILCRDAGRSRPGLALLRPPRQRHFRLVAFFKSCSR